MSAAVDGVSAAIARRNAAAHALARILFLGENWWGSCARACCASLRRLGCEVIDIDSQTFFPNFTRPSARAIVRLLSPWIVAEYNQRILEAARAFRPEVLLAFKGAFVRAQTLRALRNAGVRLYNYFPDTSPFAHRLLRAETLCEYDCVFYTKRYWEREEFLRRFRSSSFLPHGYDPELHAPPPNRQSLDRYRHDVAVVATHTAYKQSVLDRLVSLLPPIDLVIWGNGWAERCRSSALTRFIQGTAISGSPYARALSAAKINLAIMSGKVNGVAQGDETSTRTYEIPGCGGFMLHERTPELLTLFEEDKEVACFGSPAEAAEKIRYYLEHPEERAAIARAGHARCVPAYSYDNRMAQILDWHTRHWPQ